jgi:hypothetical protein
MILLFNSQPVTELVKIERLFDRAKSLYGSDFYDIKTTNWLGDQLTVESLFPNWIMESYNKDSSNVLVVPIIENYLRWLFSLEYGYGAQLDWENIRSHLTVNPIFLEAFADFYFPEADFSESPLKEVLPNIRQFLTRADCNYYNLKGTPIAIKYLICSLLGFNWDDVEVYTAGAATIQINVTSGLNSNLLLYQNFLEEYVFPIGVNIIYGTK